MKVDSLDQIPKPVTPPNVIFFGCDSLPGRCNPGHYVKDRRNPRRSYEQTPWGTALDGGLLAGVPDQVTGRVVVTKKDGWTSLAFWDRSGDSRGASNSAFMIAEDVSAERLLGLSREQWPEIFGRPNFPTLLLP